MWKRDEAVRAPHPAPTPSISQPQEPSAPRMDATRTREQNVNLGKSVVLKGDLTGSEDLTIAGQVDGKIELRQNVLTIGSNGKIKAQIFAKTIVVLGDVQGNITASERVDIRDNGSVDGDLSAPADCHRRRRALPGQHQHAEAERQPGRGEARCRAGCGGGRLRRHAWPTPPIPCQSVWESPPGVGRESGHRSEPRGDPPPTRLAPIATGVARIVATSSRLRNRPVVPWSRRSITRPMSPPARDEKQTQPDPHQRIHPLSQAGGLPKAVDRQTGLQDHHPHPA